DALSYYQHRIQIRPFSGTYHGNKYLHLGQYIKIRDEHGMEYETTITNITWKFRGGQQIKCVGEDSRTLSQARKRTQAVRMGERMKTQINRLGDTVSEVQQKIEAGDTQEIECISWNDLNMSYEDISVVTDVRFNDDGSITVEKQNISFLSSHDFYSVKIHFEDGIMTGIN
ncbi:MAG: hypothetical protein K2G14_06195, partial [Ruminococcus sp.]|nr:hypothetical protein [Ruminococcus sp.]